MPGPPKTTFRSGLRACSVNSDGAVEISSSTWAGSSRTVASRRSTSGAAPRNASSARSPRTSKPISERIRSEARWTASTWSARQDLERPEGVDQAAPRELLDRRRGAPRAAAVRLGRRGIGGDGVAVDRVHRRRCYRPRRPAADRSRRPPHAHRRTDRNLRAISDDRARNEGTTVALFRRPSLRETRKGTDEAQDPRGRRARAPSASARRSTRMGGVSASAASTPST